MCSAVHSRGSISCSRGSHLRETPTIGWTGTHKRKPISTVVSRWQRRRPAARRRQREPQGKQLVSKDAPVVVRRLDNHRHHPERVPFKFASCVLRDVGLRVAVALLAVGHGRQSPFKRLRLGLRHAGAGKQERKDLHATDGNEGDKAQPRPCYAPKSAYRISCVRRQTSE